MSAEQLRETGPEQRGPEQKELSPEQLESYLRAEDAVERAAEKSRVESGEKSESEARVEALKEAISVERGSAEKKGKESASSPAKRRHGVVSKREQSVSYKRHMKQLHTELKPTQRAFSKIIHNPIIEKTSEIIGGTIARPNAILSGAMVAFFLVLGVYVVSKYYGYTLSGFESIGAFVVGWVIGLLYDFLKVMVTGKTS